jgi:outer membrane lipoprotein carrier protein
MNFLSFTKSNIYQALINALGAFAMVLSTHAANAGGIEDLNHFYTHTKSVSADFVQVVTNKQGGKIQEVRGVMLLKRPNQFRWDYQAPYEQQIMSDGKKVWLYDIELAQVTVNDISQGIGASPAALLAGDAHLEKNFTLTQIDKQDNIAWISAIPKRPDSGFEKILLGFKAGQIHKMELQDSFGQLTSISFSRVVQNPKVADKAFKFNLPNGVDMVGD